MTRRDVEDVVWAVVLGLVAASFVFTVSIVIDAPRVWPGTILSFLFCGGLQWLFRSRERRR